MTEVLLKEDNTPITLVLTDSPIERDVRVTASLCECPGRPVIAMDCSGEMRRHSLKWEYLPELFSTILGTVSSGVGVCNLVRRQYGITFHSWFSGALASLKKYMSALKIANDLISQYRTVGTVHAHDLCCGLVGARLSSARNAHLIYDAHEIEFHRNRRNSVLRTIIDASVERCVVSAAEEVRVVNKPIAELYRSAYPEYAYKIRVVTNNHFSNAIKLTTSACRPPENVSIIFVGEGVKGRSLDFLAHDAEKAGVKVHAFFIGEVPDVAPAHGWIIGLSDYIQGLLKVAGTHRCAMWCCVDDVCLSYRLSLPNKFFQALAVGMPVIVASGTYLADIVIQYGIGYIYDRTNFDEIAYLMKTKDYDTKFDALNRFYELLYCRAITL